MRYWWIQPTDRKLGGSELGRGTQEEAEKFARSWTEYEAKRTATKNQKRFSFQEAIAAPVYRTKEIVEQWQIDDLKACRHITIKDLADANQAEELRQEQMRQIRAARQASGASPDLFEELY
jgi:TPP-dependent pyruvate/acetoin dehydrogenase alpha subunit